MDRDALRAYAQRDWAAIERLDQDHWAETFRRNGPDQAFRAAAALAEHARRARPDWPSAEDRQRDLEHHLELKRRIDRAASAFSTR